ncbi:hypothetical protein [Methanobrevibacter sp.]|uniref:hypothetical protein n=1 Tax=Methanobrevibacter sp. TaxID=66852 RepID=UPI0025E5E3D7|nr:hypothetical protein [Methanobrevibacter sp.]MBQ2961927.1 hypothetical protein [Methanobrevibacter sp.]
MSGIEDMINTFNEMGIIKRIIVGCCAVWIILMILTLLGHAILGIPLDSYTEESPTKYTDFVQLDANGDGGLSFDEVKRYDHNSEFSLSESELYTIFKRCDKNDNGLLIGGEYDYYVISVKSHLSDLKSQKEKAQREAQERAKKSSSSSSDSNPFALRSGSSGDGDGAETCPYCGSEAIYQSGNVYKCAECGGTIGNPDDLNLNYEEGYYELTLPSFYYSMNHG